MTDTLALRFWDAVVSNSGVSYHCLQPLGEGGNATTFLMVATTGSYRGLLFAAKFFRRLDKPEWESAFHQEAQFLKSCSHPAIMRYFDEGIVDDHHPYFVMEYLTRTLADVIRSRDATIAEKLSYAVQLSSALAYLASRTEQVVHRDIKPANIFVKGQSCVLGDFGLIKIAKDEEADRCHLKESLGPGMPRHYRTPELVQYLAGGPPPPAASDVYQLGLVLAELFSGVNPQQSLPQGAPYTEKIDTDLRCLDHVPDALRDQLHDLVTRMLNESPAKRPPAAELPTLWLGPFQKAARDYFQLERRVFAPAGKASVVRRKTTSP